MNSLSLETDSNGNPGRRQRKREQTAGHLAATAFRLFEAQGYDAVTMEQIAAKADVAKGTLYNHFPMKEALLAYFFHNELAAGVLDLQASMEAQSGFAARLTYLLRASADWCEAHRTYLPHYLRFRLTDAGLSARGNETTHPRSGLDRIFEDLIRAAQDAGELRSGFPPAQLARMLQFLYLGAIMRWLGQPNGDLRRELDAVLDLFLHGLISPSKPK